MPAGRLLNIAGVGFVAFCPKCLAYFLRFLTGDKYFHLSAPPFAFAGSLFLGGLGFGIQHRTFSVGMDLVMLYPRSKIVQHL
jgi:hypothetical protein